MQTDRKTQIIDYDGNMIEDLKEWMIRNKLANLGFNYNVVAILGSQSSGKSTLLNNLFKTSFDVMNTKLGHSQTTQGLWLSFDTFEDSSLSPLEKGSKTPPVNPTLILDVEGNDSKERGDNRLTFEHRSALFSLALADCLIVNLWYHSLGNFTASNYGLLKTVMEVNLELFQQDKNCPKTILLFTVRDWFEEFASIDIVKNKIVEEYLNKIWSEMKKPPGAKKAKIDNYFIVEVVGLSHAIIKKAEFLNDVENLRKKWINQLRPLQYSRNIPSDGFAHYCNNIWNTIVKQSQLDIPSQKEMLATFRCQEIKNNVISNTSKMIKEKLAASSSGQHSSASIDEFKSWAEKDIVEKSLDEYFVDASRYTESICLKTSEELLDSLFIQLQTIVDNNLNFTQRVLSAKFANELNTMYSLCTSDKNVFLFSKESNLQIHKDGKGSNSPKGDNKDKNNSQDKCIRLWSSFLSNADTLEYNTLCNFFEDYEKCNIEIRKKNKIHEFNYKPSLSILSTSICKDMNRIRNTQFTVLMDRTRATIKSRFKNMDNLLITTKNPEEYWNHTLKIVKALQESINDNLTKCFINLKGGGLGSSTCGIFANGVLDHEEDNTFHMNNPTEAHKSKNDNHANHKNNNFVEENLLNYKKIDIIKKKGKYVSTIMEEIDKQIKNKKAIAELNSYYLDEIMEVLKSKLDEISDNLASIIIQRFESVFSYDDAEQPRHWREISMAELKKIFRESKNYAFLIIDILQKHIKVELIDDYLPNNFIKEEIIEKGKNKAKRKIQEICRDAQYIQETGGKMSLKNVPLFFWVILLILGWNELLFFIRFFFRLNVILPLFFAVALILSTLFFNGNMEVLSTINKVVFFLAKSSFGFYRQLQAMGEKAAQGPAAD
ncbi:Protein SEY1-like protein [Plasmodium coatneyi]|uniref:Protein SEY1 homolog n=1 Tax=Plasmodium coatneyi TaxID=208452 RepID=A0A1B1E6B6_9APIC|nr:Protein SEY1-like protein [Plasmodium coatneyi]ANQ10574.1 Protein SEY1-like protein [Plasmodium coatneyi]